MSLIFANLVCSLDIDLYSVHFGLVLSTVQYQIIQLGVGDSVYVSK